MYSSITVLDFETFDSQFTFPRTGSLTPPRIQESGVFTTQASLHQPGTGLHPTPVAHLHPTHGLTMGKQLSYNPLAPIPPGRGVSAGHMTQQGYAGVPGYHQSQSTQPPHSDTYQTPASSVTLGG